MEEFKELKTLETPEGAYTSFPDQSARKELKAKLSAPKTAKVGDYLRISAINEDGSMLVEAMSAPVVALPTEATFAHITLETAQTADGECGVIIHPEGTEDVPELTFYGMRGDEAVRLNNVADAIDDRSVPNLGQVKNLVQKNENDSGQNPSQGGLTTAQVNALDGMFKVCAYDDSKDVSGAYAAFREAFGLDSSGGDTTDKSLTSISATYSGGSVPVGTAVSALTGVVVTAHYSDGSTAVVTGYTLSGTIAEGSNTVTVSYGGMTATITVVGITPGHDAPALEQYEYELTNTGKLGDSNGGLTNSGAYNTTDFIEVDASTSTLTVAFHEGVKQTCYVQFFAGDTFIRRDTGGIQMQAHTFEIPADATRFRVTVLAEYEFDIYKGTVTADEIGGAA